MRAWCYVCRLSLASAMRATWSPKTLITQQQLPEVSVAHDGDKHVLVPGVDDIVTCKVKHTSHADATCDMPGRWWR